MLQIDLMTIKRVVVHDLPPVDVPIRSGSPGSRLLDGYVG